MHSLEFTPTPIQKLYTDENGNTFFLKREDLLPYSFGGNKVRIGLEYMKDLRQNGCDHMLAYGNARSNLCRVLSNLCAGEGVPITILSPADDDGQRRFSCNEQLCRSFGAIIKPCLKSDVAYTVNETMYNLIESGKKPYYIYGDRFGRGNEAVPARAYVPVYDEIQSQGTFDVIALACGTGMTLGGLLAGRKLHGGSERLIGISIARDKASAAAHTLTYANAVLSSENALNECDVEICDDFRRIYGDYGPETAQLIRDMMRDYGIPMDGTYVGKAFDGLRQLAQHEGWKNQKILFIHTGGTPLFFDNLNRE